MKLIKLIFLFSILSIIFNSCSSFEGAGKFLRNEKTKTTDEFLVKKNRPLTQPPDFEKIPEPGSIEEKTVLDENSFKIILKSRQPESTGSQTKSSSTEESILKKIKK